MQYKKLFNKSEIEYITPFLKLWMAFNNRYKKDLLTIKTDREAINSYKIQGNIKNEFLRLLNGRSNQDEKFQNALALFIKEVNDCNFNNFEYPSDLFTRNPSDRTIEIQGLVFVSSQYKEFYFTSDDENRLFESTLEIMYQIRCKLVHGDFDIDDISFNNLVEQSYKILYPIIDKILQLEEDGCFFCKNDDKHVDARASFNEGKMILLAGSKVTKDIGSYSKPEERMDILKKRSHESENYFEITSNIEFSSPSAASSFCLGNSSNGWNDWKNKAGNTMNDVLRNNN